MSDDLERLVRFLIHTLVDDPSSVSVTSERDGAKVTYRVTASEADKGRLIGKGGRTARALRVLVSAAGSKKGVKAELEIQDK